MSDSIPIKISQPFRPRARMLQLLGDELIGSARLAVFELVKNAYDADANEVVVCLDLESAQGSAIIVTDDGEGMTLDVLRSVWLVPGDDHRQKQRLSDRKTPKHHRLPLGEKGLGRFAVHKLGNQITLVTRASQLRRMCRRNRLERIDSTAISRRSSCHDKGSPSRNIYRRNDWNSNRNPPIAYS